MAQRKKSSLSGKAGYTVLGSDGAPLYTNTDLFECLQFLRSIHKAKLVRNVDEALLAFTTTLSAAQNKKIKGAA